MLHHISQCFPPEKTFLTLSLLSLGIWDQVVQKVAKLREESSMLKLFTEHVKGEEMYGLTVHAVMRITESVRICRICFLLVMIIDLFKVILRNTRASHLASF